MDEKPITTLGPWSYHNPIDMAADEQSFSVNKEVKWMNEMSDKDLKDMKDYALTELGLIKQGFANAEDAVERGLKRELVLINQLKECREKNKKAKADMENTDLQYFQEKQLITDDLEKWKKDVLQAADDYDKQIEQRTKDACFGAGWEWIQDDFGEQFGYDPTDDTDKGDFKQAIDEAKIE